MCVCAGARVRMKKKKIQGEGGVLFKLFCHWVVVEAHSRSTHLSSFTPPPLLKIDFFVIHTETYTTQSAAAANCKLHTAPRAIAQFSLLSCYGIACLCPFGGAHPIIISHPPQEWDKARVSTDPSLPSTFECNAICISRIDAISKGD